MSFFQAYLKLPSSQILALFNKTMRKLHSQLHGAAAREIEAALPRVREVKMTAHDRTVDEDLDEAAADVQVNRTLASSDQAAVHGV